MMLSRYRHNQLSPEHILLTMLENPKNAAVDILNYLNADVDSLRRDVERVISSKGGYYYSGGSTTSQIYITPDATKVINEAKRKQREWATKR